MRKNILFLCLLCLSMVARGQTGYECVYWMDNDMTTRHSISLSDGTWQTSIDVSDLEDGLHSLHIQVKDTVWSSPVTRYFFRQSATAQGMRYRYWFDNDNSTVQISDTELTWLDVSSLDDGLHMLHVMAEGEVATQTVSYHFIKVPQTAGVEYLNCLCYIDGTLHTQECVTAPQGIAHWDIDVSEISRGLHQLQVQVVTPSGAASSLYNALFVRTITDEELSGLRCFYIIDDSLTHIVEGTYEDQGYHFELDVTELPDGEHRITYMLVDDKEVVTDMQSATFIKESDGEGISILINDKEETLLYDISGRRVTGPLTRGVYIINSRKVLIK